MQAITYSRYGSPEVLELRDVPRPVPGEDDVLIRVMAAEATKSDCEMRSFRYAVKWFWLPMRLALGIRRPRRPILGGYFAGIVESVGKRVRGFAPGDEVVCTSPFRRGGYGEYAVVPARQTIVPKPANMRFAEAAAIALGGLNALHFMKLAGVRPGERVLINGAGGSIGAYAVQIAKALGAEVTAVDRAHKQAGLRRLGADHFIEAAPRLGAPGRYDVLFDMVPGSDYGACLQALTSDGRYLVGNPRIATMLRTVLTTRFSRRTARFRFAPETRSALGELTSMIERGEIGSIVDAVYPMAQAVDAHRRVDSEQRVGAIVIAIGEPAARVAG